MNSAKSSDMANLLGKEGPCQAKWIMMNKTVLFQLFQAIFWRKPDIKQTQIC